MPKSTTNHTSQSDRSQASDFRDVFVHAPVGMATIDLDGRFIQVNPAFCTLMGYTEHEFLSGPVTLREVTHPDDLDEVWQKVRQLIADEIPSFSVEKRCVHKSGEIMLTCVTATPRRNASGDVFGVVGVVENITQRKQGEARLREMAEQRRMALDAGLLGWWNLDIVSGELRYDARACTLLGFEKETMSLEVVLGHIHPDDHGRIVGILQQAMISPAGEVYADEFRFNRSDGSTLWLASRGKTYSDHPEEPGIITRFVGTVEDISERKRSEQALAESEKRYRTLFNAIDEGFCIIEVIFDEQERPVDYRFIETNPAFERQTGLYEVQGKRMRELVPDHDEHWFTMYAQVALTGEPARFENRAEALERWFDVYAFRFGEPDLRQVAVLFSDITERKRAEQAVRESEERYRTLFENQPIGIVVADPQGNLLSMNSAGLRMHGWSSQDEIVPSIKQRAEVLELRYLEGRVVPIDDWPISRALRGEPVKDYVLHLRNRLKNSEHVVSYTVSSVRDASGNIRLLLFGLQDLTDRKRTEAELAFQKHALDEASIVAITDRAGTITYVNDKFCQISGYSRGELIGANHRIINSGYHPRAFFESLYATITKGEVWRGEIRNRRKDGSYYWVDTTIVPALGPKGKPERYVAIRTDITERKLAEEALKRSEEQFRSLANSLPQYVWIADARGRLYWFNERWTDLLGLSSEELPHFDWETVYHPDHFERVSETFRKSQETGEPWEDTFQLRDKNGQYRWFLGRAVPLRDDQERIVRWFGTVTDITEERESHMKALERKSTAMSEVLRSIGEQKEQLKQQMANDMENIVMPTIQRLKEAIPAEAQEQIKMIEETMHESTGRFLNALLAAAPTLTPREVEICRLIRQDLPTKQIADILNVSPATVQKQRDHIRKKLGLTGKDQNLLKFLLSLTEV